MAKRFQRRRFFLKINQSEIRIACGSHVCKWIGTKWAIFYREPSIDTFYLVSVHLAKRFQRRRFKKIGWSETRIAYGLSIDASYQVSLALAEGFQMKRLKCKKLTDDGRRTTDAKCWQKIKKKESQMSEKNYVFEQLIMIL